MSISVQRGDDSTETIGRVDVTEQTVREVESFASDADTSVHIERRGTRTYVVAE
ncbi:MAG: hypothetical protein ABEI99_02835 [Halobaculum sp.]